MKIQMTNSFVLSCLVIWISGCASPTTEIDTMTNADVRWDGNILGLSPTIVGPAKRVLKQPPHKVWPTLVAALQDSNRFVAAHVILTELRTGVPYNVSAEQWNGLKVELFSDGRVVVDPQQQSRIANYWISQSPPAPRK